MSNMSTDEKNASEWAWEGVAGDLKDHLGNRVEFSHDNAPCAWVRVQLKEVWNEFVAITDDIARDRYQLTQDTPIVICSHPDQRPVPAGAAKTDEWVEMTAGALAARVSHRLVAIAGPDLMVRARVSDTDMGSSEPLGIEMGAAAAWVTCGHPILIRRSDLDNLTVKPTDATLRSRIEALRDKGGVTPEVADILTELLDARD